MPSREPRSRRPLARRLATLAFVLVVVCPLALEGTLRFALFGRGALAARLGSSLRRPALFADPRGGPVYWHLEDAFTAPGARGLPKYPDDFLGWVSHDVAPGDYTHAAAALVGSRRPIVLYGDSFSACATASADCFQGLLQRSPRGADAKLLNYGVGGYGLDQAFLLLRESIAHYHARDPVVVVGCLGDDLDRSALSFRHWPKPRFRLAGGALELEPARAPDAEPAPLGVVSYLWRWYVHGSPLPSWRLRRDLAASAREQHAAALRPLGEALVLAVRDFLVAEGVDHFFLLFPEARDLTAGEPGWQEELLVAVLEAHAIPYVNARADFEDDRAATGRAVDVYFRPGDGHYNELGNEVAFRGLVRGLERYTDG